MTKKVITKKALSILISGVIGYPIGSYADDTEIYFSDINKAPKPNVFFMLDNSGSMKYTLNTDRWIESTGNTETTKARLAAVKEAVGAIMARKDVVKNLRMGLSRFSGINSNGSVRIGQPIIDIDEIDEDADIPASDRVAKGANTTILKRKELVFGYDDGVLIDINKEVPSHKNRVRLGIIGYMANNNLAGFRFDNILLKRPSEAGITDINKGIIKAELNFFHADNSGHAGKLGKKTIQTYIDPAINASRFDTTYYGEFSRRTNGPSKTELMDLDYIPVDCYLRMFSTETNASKDCQISIDVTQFLRDKISDADWQSGNAVAFIVKVTNDSGSNLIDLISSSTMSRLSDWNANLTLEVDNRLIAENKRTKREKILDANFGFDYDTFSGVTQINWGLVEVSQYISNIPATAPPYDPSAPEGPYHFKGKVDVTDPCQMTHIILMTDGQPSGETNDKSWGSITRLKRYIGQSNLEYCRIFNNQDKTTWTDETSYLNFSETCGRALASWMSRTPHVVSESGAANKSKLGGDVRIHTIGFAIAKQESKAKEFLADLATAGQGIYRDTVNTEELINAFQDIIETALLVNKPSASGTVTLSPQSGFDQRSEVFYSLFKSGSYDYWSGNIKGFKMIYVPYQLSTGKTIERAVLADWAGAHAVINEDDTFKNNFDTAWSKGDSGDMTKGGVVDQLGAPAERKAYTTTGGNLLAGTSLEASSYGAGITDADLQVTVDASDPNPTEARTLRGRGLLDFIRGYTYQAGGSTTAAPKKIGDSANNGVTLVSYGCNDTNKQMLDCDFNQLHQVGLLATNDGFFRGYDLRTGKNIFEFMPKEMLPLIDKLQARKGLNINKVRSYGLDGRVAIYHDDTNKNGYIDNGETAYAIVVSGRGGSYIYGIDISNETNPLLKWVITPETAGFSKLGKTWSIPAAGKVKLAGNVSPTPVIVFGGGYDESQDTNPIQHEDTVGNALYVVNPTNGQLLWSTSTNMKYSIPGDVTLLTDKTDNQLITDIFFGDMGGQLWRFKVVNGANNYASMFVAGGGDQGIVASISGSDEANTRRFYQKPMIYKLTGDLTNFISVNIGSGYKAHPLVKNNQDRFYSFRLPLVADTNTSVIKDGDLPNANPTNTTTALNMDKGFKVQLAQDSTDAGKGEKVISNAFADVDRLVFNTYIPSVGLKTNSCTPVFGSQRTYYFSLTEGVSLLKSGYTEITSATLPLDVVPYCNASTCTIISSMNDLSSEASSLVDSQFFDKKKGGALVRKTTWTDIFDPSVQ